MYQSLVVTRVVMVTLKRDHAFYTRLAHRCIVLVGDTYVQVRVLRTWFIDSLTTPLHAIHVSEDK